MRRPIMFLGLLLLLLGLAFTGARMLERFVAASKKYQTAAPKGAGANESVSFSGEEWLAIQMLAPLPPLPADRTNKYLDSAAAARLGQQLFFEPRLSGPI